MRRRSSGRALKAVREVLATAVVLGFAMLLLTAGSAAGNDTHRTSAEQRDCSTFSSFAPKIDFYGPRSRYSTGGVDATGCDSWPYELLSPVPQTFFAGTNFRTGVTAYEYGSRETTELKNGEQLLTVTNPTKFWLASYSGFDTCTTRSTATTSDTRICTVGAVVERPPDWRWYIPVAIVLVLLMAFVVYQTRPAAPIRRGRHFRTRQESLTAAAARQGQGAPTAMPTEVKVLQRRLQRLERSIAAELSESQHRLFTHQLRTGRHRMALEAVARWFTELKAPLPEHLRAEFAWLAATLEIEEFVLPLLDHTDNTGRGEEQANASTATGFDVPLEEFTRLVGEALDSLPPEFGQAMTNVALTIEEESEQGDPLGVYIGVPLTARRYRQWRVHPDKIIIYRRTICANAQTSEQVKALVYVVVLHEIAHHFGIGDARLRELGW